MDGATGRTKRGDRVDQIDVQVKALVLMLKPTTSKLGKARSFVIAFACIGFLLLERVLSVKKPYHARLKPMLFLYLKFLTYLLRFNLNTKVPFF